MDALVGALGGALRVVGLLVGQIVVVLGGAVWALVVCLFEGLGAARGRVGVWWAALGHQVMLLRAGDMGHFVWHWRRFLVGWIKRLLVCWFAFCIAVDFFKPFFEPTHLSKRPIISGSTSSLDDDGFVGRMAWDELVEPYRYLQLPKGVAPWVDVPIVGPPLTTTTTTTATTTTSAAAATTTTATSRPVLHLPKGVAPWVDATIPPRPEQTYCPVCRQKHCCGIKH
ncbi:hypothetical protein ANO11243_090060 [Dothideomycetidae sp. 11243]|nr:hypothetical protein ANO11243_090060 [fungal sp. No.11243]